MAKIAAELNAKWLPPRPTTRKGTTWQAEWTHTTVAQMLRQEVYTAWRAASPTASPAPPGTHHTGKWTLMGAARGVKHASPEEGYTLSGLVRCSGCGYAMTHTVEVRKGVTHRTTGASAGPV